MKIKLSTLLKIIEVVQEVIKLIQKKFNINNEMIGVAEDEYRTN